MKKLSIKAKVYLSFQVIFMILSIVGGILFFIYKIDNIGMFVCCMIMFLGFGGLYNSTKDEKE